MHEQAISDRRGRENPSLHTIAFNIHTFYQNKNEGSANVRMCVTVKCLSLERRRTLNNPSLPRASFSASRSTERLDAHEPDEVHDVRVAHSRSALREGGAVWYRPAMHEFTVEHWRSVVVVGPAVWYEAPRVQLLTKLQRRSAVAVGTTDWNWVATTHRVRAWQRLLLVGVLGAISNSDTAQAVTVAHPRSVVGVGGPLWYWFDAQTVTLRQTRSDVTVGRARWNCPVRHWATLAQTRFVVLVGTAVWKVSPSVQDRVV